MAGEKRYRLDTVWQDGQWRRQIGVTTDASGAIVAWNQLSEVAQTAPEWLFAQRIPGVCLPTQVNAHSHAFQWGFAGQTEYRTTSTDSFWTWRTQMFRFLEQLSPERMYDVARALYQSLLHAGYSHVGEFHYVHADAGGKPLQPLTQYADAVVQAALDVGLHICLLPTLYQRGGFDGRPLVSGQRRFYLSLENFWKLLDEVDRKWQGQRGYSSGMALHSLRAVAGDIAVAVAREFFNRKPQGVLHIHAAEQTLEIDDCLAATGQRSVEWILDHLSIDRRWSLIHATHLTDSECQRLAQSGATVVLCPTTEASLGDGIFAAENYRSHGGQWAIGGDSHVGVSIPAELRTLETVQRLATRRRAVLCSEQQSCGEYLYQSTLVGGRQSLGLNADPWAVGEPFNLLVLTAGEMSAWVGTEPARILDQYLFTEPTKIAAHVMIRGQWQTTAPVAEPFDRQVKALEVPQN